MIAALLGLGCGVGFLLIVRGLFPQRVPLAQMLANLHPGSAPRPRTTFHEQPGWAARLGRGLAPFLASASLPSQTVRRDLVVLEVAEATHLAEKVTAALVGLLLPPLVLLAVGTAAGFHVGFEVPLIAAFIVSAVLFLVPDLMVRDQAKKRRAEMRHALSAFLDLTVVALAGGVGVDQALDDAASVLDGWSATQLQHALTNAELERISPWGPLGELGRHLDVSELTELASTVALAGREGAKVRASLAAKAAALRTRQLADAHTAAQQATELMALPLVLLFAGFLVFLGYPGVVGVLTGL